MKIEELFEKSGFLPNEAQKNAIMHLEGPLFLTAGPGSGKTRVLLWRTVNLIVFQGVAPSEIFLSTFTEKAALQLRDGLRSLLGMVTNETGIPYDITEMSIGTVHSLCRKLLIDRRFTDNQERRRSPILMDELGQYFRLYNR
ncbi:MAG: UvrD-helicase domain-containing protein, partial [Rectinemataceae bacterium]|nr:UvrD-helicase domain-containing protein [Rectinemataceae bacterium]